MSQEDPLNKKSAAENQIDTSTPSKDQSTKTKKVQFKDAIDPSDINEDTLFGDSTVEVKETKK